MSSSPTDTRFIANTPVRSADSEIKKRTQIVHLDAKGSESEKGWHGAVASTIVKLQAKHGVCLVRVKENPCLLGNSFCISEA